MLRIANDPSVGLVKIREHAEAAVPKLSEERRRLEQARGPLDICAEDMDYAALQVRSIPELPQFNRIKSLLQRSILNAERILEREGEGKVGRGDADENETERDVVEERVAQPDDGFGLVPKSFD